MSYKHKVPIGVRIAGTWLNIKYRATVHAPDAPSVEVSGYTEPMTDHIIMISKAEHHSVDGLMSTLLHECLHAAIRITGHLATVGEKNEERLVIALENALKHTLTFKQLDASSDIKWGVRTFPFE